MVGSLTMEPITFADRTIQLLFGHEAAEDEDAHRLKDYYFKGSVFQRATADLPLRILVGHKGIGKSALFQVARNEDLEQGILSLLLRPDDVFEIATSSSNLLESIRNWKQGLARIIYDKCVGAIGATTDPAIAQKLHVGIQLVTALTQTCAPLVAASSIADPKSRVINGFMKHRRVRVYLDDLDRGWTATPDSIMRLSSLLNAMRDMTKEHPGLEFRLALRSDVYFLVRTSDESTDKIEGSVVWYTWSNHEILAMLVKRVQSFLGNELRESELIAMPQFQLASKLDSILAPRFLGHGGWKNIPTHRMLMSLIRRRPRDLVKLCSTAAQKAFERGSHQIATPDFASVFDQYSQGRLQDTTNEFRSELPTIELLLLNMRPTTKQRRDGRPYLYTTAELLTKINGIQGRCTPFVFYGGRKATNKDLAAFMYKIGFLTARKETGDKIERKFFEENKYLSSSFVDFGYDWEIHPAYRWALQPGDDVDIQRLLDAGDDS